MRKRLLLAGVLAVVVCATVGVAQSGKTEKPGGALMRPGEVMVMRPEVVSVGRFQVVSGVTGFLGNIMLLDTSTGYTWVVCEVTGDEKATSSEKAWCRLPKRSGLVLPGRPSPSQKK